MRQMLSVLLGVLVVPIIIVFAGICWRWEKIQYAKECESVLEQANAASLAYAAFIRDIKRQTFTLGKAMPVFTGQSFSNARSLLLAIDSQYLAIDHFFWADPSGRIVVSSNPADEGIRIDSTPEFKAVVSGNDIKVGNLQRSPFDGHLEMVVARGVRGEDGHLLGIIAACINPDKLRVAALQLVLLPSESIFIFDSRGILAYCSGEVADQCRAGIDTAREGVLSVAHSERKIFGGLLPGIDRKSRIQALVPVAGTGWVAGASRLRSEVMRPVIRSLLAAGIALIIVVAVSILSARSIVRTMLRSIRNVRNRIEAMELGAPLNEKTPIRVAEFDELWKSFDRMAAEVRKANALLENRVRDRTAELHNANMALQAQINERLRAEEELQKYREHLEDLVKERAEELNASNEQLRKEAEERKRAEEEIMATARELARSNKDLEQFAYVSSHDLQEPLRMITGYLQLLKRRYKSRLDDEADEFIAYAVDGADRMRQLITDLLAYSRAGSRGLMREPVDCRKPLGKALLNLKSTIEQRGAHITCDALPEISADFTQLTQVFQNLIGNSIKFCKDAAPRVHVGARRYNGSWDFSISDNGIGIERQYLERIFGVFQRLHVRAHFSGNGIGLSICKKIIERHGGQIWAESEPGKGSVFHFTLPAPGETKCV